MLLSKLTKYFCNAGAMPTSDQLIDALSADSFTNIKCLERHTVRRNPTSKN